MSVLYHSPYFLHTFVWATNNKLGYKVNFIGEWTFEGSSGTNYFQQRNECGSNVTVPRRNCKCCRWTKEVEYVQRVTSLWRLEILLMTVNSLWFQLSWLNLIDQIPIAMNGILVMQKESLSILESVCVSISPDDPQIAITFFRRLPNCNIYHQTTPSISTNNIAVFSMITPITLDKFKIDSLC